jgi:hypothetical protein
MYKKFSYRRLSGAVVATLLIVVLVAPSIASAHGRRTVADKYQFVVGFLAEPAFAGQQNGIDLTVCQGECQTNADGTLKNPVKDVDKMLKAEAVYNGQTFPVTLTPRFRADGKYNGVFFPTKAGEYTFHFSGTVSGDKIDERFVSGKDGFGSVEEVTPLQFPAAANATSNLEQQVKDASDKASSATTFGIIGIVIGVVGLLLGGAGLMMAQRARAAAPVASQERSPVSSGTGRGPQGG